MTPVKLLVDPLPGATRYRVECRYAVTTVAWPDRSPIDMGAAQVATWTLQLHESECGKCDLTTLHRDYGDPTFRAGLVDLVSKATAAMAARRPR